MTLFRPCIDLHQGRVKQIVGGTLRDDNAGLAVNFESEHPSEWYADLYRRDGLRGGHLILLGPGNEEAALRALAAYPGGLQVGGGVNAENAASYLEKGASQVILTSWLFPDGRFAPERLEMLAKALGRDRIVVDLSCRRTGAGWTIAMNRWQTLTRQALDEPFLRALAPHAAEFLVHAADVEGRCEGIDLELVRFLGRASSLPVTYAGGSNRLEDLEAVEKESKGRVDLSIGSALDLFGGKQVRYADCLAWNRKHRSAPRE